MGLPVDPAPCVGEDNAVAQTQPIVVVLTGGPSSGKSSAMALLRDRLSVRGFQVLTVPENATHLLANSDGFQPEWAGTDQQVLMQRVFLDFQLAQEEAFKEFAQLHPTKRAVLLLDCCTLNSKVYLSDEQWAKVLDLPGRPQLSEAALLSRYDMVVHMVTCAHEEHLYEWGPASNNPARYHSPEQAKETDERSLQVFKPHPQLRVVPHFSDFSAKIGKVLEFVNDALHVDGLAGRRRRRTVGVEVPEALESLLRSFGAACFIITSTFLDEQMQRSLRRRARVPAKLWLERRARQSTAAPPPGQHFAPEDLGARPPFLHEAAEVTYERRSQVRPQEGSQGSAAGNYLTRKVIKEEDYYLSVAGQGARVATKYVMNFVEGSSYYELFFFQGPNLLLDFGEGAPVPSWLRLLEDEAAAAVAAEPAAAAAALDCETKAPVAKQKRTRVLRSHTTEAAALFCAVEPQ